MQMVMYENMSNTSPFLLLRSVTYCCHKELFGKRLVARLEPLWQPRTAMLLVAGHHRQDGL